MNEKITRELVIIGGGAIGCESGYFFASECGAKVQILEMRDAMCKDSYPSQRAALLPRMDKAGMILDCSVTDCSYNKEKSCGAAAITVGYSTSCTTFIPLTVKGGLAKAESFVGACQKADCAHNNALECTAASISVGAGTADCLSYEAR